MKQLFIFILAAVSLLFSTQVSYAQVGGTSTFKFLDLTNSARIAGLGGSWLAVKDGDINTALRNPSLISDEMHNHLALDYVNYYDGSNYGYAIYSRSFEKLGSFTGAIQYINYGEFTEADATGQITGAFTPSEYAITVGWGRELTPHFSIGANVKGIISQLYTGYNSWGIATDLAGTYYSEEDDLTVSMIINNIGFQVDPYTTGNNEPLPFNMALGMSQRLKHLPVRYHIQYNHLEKWDLSYDDPSEIEYDPISGEEIEENGFADFGDKLMRHFAFGVELMPAKFLDIYAGYNYQRRQELAVDTQTAMVGFSWGFGLNFKKFNIDFSRATYSLAGSTNNITLGLNLNTFFVPKSAK